MPIIQETLDGGLVTARDGTLLQAGELQQADDCIYRPNDPAIHRAPGRTAFNAAALGSPSPVKGVAHLAFDANDDILLAYVITSFYYSPFTAVTGTFVPMPTAGVLPDATTDILDVVHYNGAYLTIHNAAGLVGRPRMIRYASQYQSTVAGCTINAGNPIIITNVANSFQSVVAGQIVTISAGPGTLGANTTVLSVDSSVQITVSPNPTGSGAANGTTLAFSGSPSVYSRIAGLDPVITFGNNNASSASIIAGTADGVAQSTGTWNANLGNGYYYFLYTEAIIPTSPDDYANGFVESTFLGTPQVAQISDFTTQDIVISFPAAANNSINYRNSATHFIVYMSVKQTTSTPIPALATFKRIGSPIRIISLTARQVETLTDIILTQGLSGPTTTANVGAASAWVNQANLISNNGNPDGLYSWTSANDGLVALKNFGFIDTGAYAGQTVRGIEVEVVAGAGEGVGTQAAIYIQLRHISDPTKISPLVRMNLVLSTLHARTVGGTNDRWGVSWAPADFTNANFQVYIYKVVSNSVQRPSVDSVRVKVHYTGTKINNDGIPFSTITYRSQVGITVSEPTNMPPPSPSTGDIFEGQVVLNDMGRPTLIRYSLPDKPEYFPQSYFLNFESKKKDKVTCIRKVGQILVVGLQASIKRVNYLPIESDAELVRGGGRAHEDLAIDHGIAGPLAATVFDLSGGGPVLAYISYSGPRLTDGITTRLLNKDLDWANTVDLANLDKCMLRNYPALKLLVLYYAPFSGNGTLTKALAFSYDPDKIKDGGHLPVLGPISVSARSACEAVLNGVPKLITGHNTDGKIYMEDSGVTDASGSAIVPIVRTRLVYPMGIGGQGREERIYVRHSANGQILNLVSNATLIAPTTLTSAAQFGSVIVGMLVTGVSIKPGTIVTAKASSSSITISQAVDDVITAQSLAFTDGTIGITVRGQNMREAIADLETIYCSTDVGGLVVVHPDNFREAMEVKIAKVILPSGSPADLSTAMRIHYFAYLAFEGGTESNRSAS